jgi:hypothetical protein
MQQGAAESLDQVERAAFHLVGAVDRQIDLPVRREGGQRDAQRRCLGRSLLGGPDETQSLPITRCQGFEREGRSRARAEPDDHAIPDQLGSCVGRRALERDAVRAGAGAGTYDMI